MVNEETDSLSNLEAGFQYRILARDVPRFQFINKIYYIHHHLNNIVKHFIKASQFVHLCELS